MQEERRGGGVNVVEEYEGDDVVPERAEGPDRPVAESGGKGYEEERVKDGTAGVR